MLRTPYGHPQYAQAGVAVYNFARDSKNVEMWVEDDWCTGCIKSQDRCLNFERIYLEYYYRYNGKIKIYSRFGYGKSIPLGFSSVSIVIFKIYTSKVQTAILTFCTPYISNKIQAKRKRHLLDHLEIIVDFFG